MKKIFVASYLIFLLLIKLCYSQEQSNDGKYLLNKENKLEMIVHIWGEVKKPGEYRVPDDTNVLELISKAGGATQYSNLSEVILTRSETNYGTLLADNNEKLASKLSPKKRVIKINLKDYLNKEDYKQQLPLLQPGDIVRVKRNGWFKWQTAIRIASQIALVAHGLYYFSRINY